MLTLLLCVLLSSFAPGIATIPERHSLYDALHHFEVLHTRHITRHTPHRAHNNNRETTQLHFRSLDRDFNLILTPSREALHSSIHVTVVTDGGEERRHFPFPYFYTGHLLGVEGSQVTAHVHPTSSVLTASIHTADEIYYVEPSFRHFHESHDFHMITYKHSHLKFNLTGQSSQHFCGNRDHVLPRQQVLPWQQPLYRHVDERQRLRRDLAGDACTLHLVATPSFHNQYSSGDPDTTSLFLLNLIDEINRNTFQTADFRTRPSDLGLVVTNITIFTDVSSRTPEYARKDETNSESLLKLFSEANWSGVCLAHLFTAIEFSDNRLGVAYVASRDRDDIGGICSPLVKGNAGPETANVGVSSFRNSGNRLLLRAEARLVTAHEIGHGWGSEHDPTGDPNCSPPVGEDQGKYLMFPSATDGDQTNNAVFSPCSVRMISAVVERKGGCFQERSQLVGLCGNYRVEDGEECDAGALGMVGSDPCCSADCKLRSTTPQGDTVECSGANDACCEDCRVSSPESQRVCVMHRPGNAQCLRSVYCMGESTCPTNLTFVDVFSSCGQGGRCLPPDSECTVNGNCTKEGDGRVCFNFCRWHGLEECFCTGSDECKFCCRNSTTCEPFRNSLRPERSSCVGGFCEDGECIPAAQDLIQRLFDLFDNPSLDAFVQFMRENIVGSIIIMTAVIWIPASFMLHIYDGYRWREHKRVAREFEADLQDAEIEDEDDLHFYDDMAQSQPGVLKPEAKLALVRMDSGLADYFGPDDLNSPPHSGPYSGFFDHRLSTITEESQILNPARDNILAFMTPRSRGVADDRGHFLQHSSFDKDPSTEGTLL